MSRAHEQQIRPDFILEAIDARPPADWTSQNGELRLLESTTRMMALHQQLEAARQSGLLIVLLGMDASGKDRTCRMIASGTDPRAIRFHFFGAPNPEDRMRDFLARYHAVTPPRGSVAVFNRSYYDDLVYGPPADYTFAGLDHVAAFERLLEASSIRILRLYLHISADEQSRRLKLRRETPSMLWKFSEGDAGAIDRRPAEALAMEAVIKGSMAHGADWYAVPCDDRGHANEVAAGIVCYELSRVVSATGIPR